MNKKGKAQADILRLAYAELIKTVELATRAQYCSEGVARALWENAHSALTRYETLVSKFSESSSSREDVRSIIKESIKLKSGVMQAYEAQDCTRELCDCHREEIALISRWLH